MLDENTLYGKINKLQAKMLKFHEEMSPVKTQEPEKAAVPHDEESQFLSTCIYIAFGFLKIILCIIGPTLFPAIVYCIEGSSQLFWQVTAASCVIAILLAMTAVTMLCLNVKLAQAKVKEMLIRFSDNRTFQALREAFTSDFLKMNIHKVLYPTALLYVGCTLGYITYVMNNWIGFYASLVSIGFVCGILTVTVCDILRSPELLPFHSPCKIRMELATPTRQVKRELEFTPRDEQEGIATPRLLAPSTALIGENPELTATPKTSVLPNYASSINREEAGNSKLYQLPIHFGRFLRGLKS